MFLMFPLLLSAQDTEIIAESQCYREVVRFEVDWSYHRDLEERSRGGVILSLVDGSKVRLVAKTPDLLDIWLKILDQDPKKGKVYYLRKNDLEGVLLGNVLIPPFPDCP